MPGTCACNVSCMQSVGCYALCLISKLLSASACVYQPWQEVLHLQHTLLIPGAAGFGNCSCFGSRGDGRCLTCTGHCGVNSHYHARKTIKEVGAEICPSSHALNVELLLCVLVCNACATRQVSFCMVECSLAAVAIVGKGI